jgi:hypothetical protein
MRLLSRSPLLLLIPLLASGQEALSPDLALLVKVKGKMAQNLKQLSNFTCTEFIERSLKGPADKTLKPLDTVRVEVAYVAGTELFGPSRGGRVDQQDIQKLVSGTVSRGTFATLVASTVFGAATAFHYEGETEINGQPAVLFSFHANTLGSNYQLTTPSGRARVGYGGKFWADPVSFDLLRFELAADEIPPVLELSSESQTIDYSRVRIGESAFLLPQVSELKMSDQRGYATRNLTTYQGCRQFSAESTLASFGEDALKPPPSDLPDDFKVEVRWETTLDPAISAAGDHVAAKLLDEIKLNNVVKVPRGAQLNGQVASITKARGGYAVKLVFTSFDFKGGHVELGQRVSEATQSGMRPSLRGRTCYSTASAKLSAVVSPFETRTGLTLPQSPGCY